jgi:hypothetical protein
VPLRDPQERVHKAGVGERQAALIGALERAAGALVERQAGAARPPARPDQAVDSAVGGLVLVDMPRPGARQIAVGGPGRQFRQPGAPGSLAAQVEQAQYPRRPRHGQLARREADDQVPAEHEAQAREVEAALERERRELRKRERALEKARETVADVVERRPEHADRAFDLLNRMESQVAEQAERVQRVLGQVGEHQRAVSTDEVLDRYNEIKALVEGRLTTATDATALNLALRDMLACATVDLDDRGRIAVQFQLAHDPATFPEGEAFEVATVATPERIRDPRYGQSLRSMKPRKPDSSPQV